jgi:P27 family predicted phage terminase small subunit
MAASISVLDAGSRAVLLPVLASSGSVSAAFVNGRKPKPTILKEPRPSRMPKAEPQLDADIGKPPSWLSKPAQVLWRSLVKRCPSGMLKLVDEPTLATYCEAECLRRKATAALNKPGQKLTVLSPTKREPMQNPLMYVVNKQAQIMMKAAAELGFTPTSRARAPVEKPQSRERANDPANPFAAFRR